MSGPGNVVRGHCKQGMSIWDFEGQSRVRSGEIHGSGNAGGMAIACGRMLRPLQDLFLKSVGRPLSCVPQS